MHDGAVERTRLYLTMDAILNIGIYIALVYGLLDIFKLSTLVFFLARHGDNILL